MRTEQRLYEQAGKNIPTFDPAYQLIEELAYIGLNPVKINKYGIFAFFGVPGFATANDLRRFADVIDELNGVGQFGPQVSV